MLGIIYSLIPLTGWGISDYMASKMSKQAHPAAINLFYFFVAGIPTLIFSSFFGLPEFSVWVMVQFIIVSAILSVGYIAMLKAFSSGDTGVVAPIANAYAIVTLALAVLFLDANITWQQAMAVLVVVAGISLLSYHKSSVNRRDSKKTVFYAVVALVFFGVGFASFDVIATQQWYQNVFLFGLAEFIVTLPIFLVWLKKDRVSELKKLTNKPMFYVGCFVGGLGTIGLFLALESIDDITIPAAIAAASPLVTVLLARLFDKERLVPWQYVGAVVSVSGIVLLSLNS